LEANFETAYFPSLEICLIGRRNREKSDSTKCGGKNRNMTAMKRRFVVLALAANFIDIADTIADGAILASIICMIILFKSYRK
jgi:hypothetical protein